MEQVSKHLSPKIESQRWGKIQIQGEPESLKDAKLFPGGARTWDWNETGTRHNPGIQFADVEELINKGAKVIVLSKGVQEALKVPGDVIQKLEKQGIEVKVAQTEEAVKLYNQLVEQGKAVGGLFHSTC